MDPDVIIKRRIFKPDITIGDLLICEKNFDPAPFCNTLEPTVRAAGVKIPGKTAIPEGIYKFTIEHSPRLGYNLPLLQDVPGFTAIEHHIGNFAHDTEGCALIGLYSSNFPDQIIKSTYWFGLYMAKLITLNKSDFYVQYCH